MSISPNATIGATAVRATKNPVDIARQSSPLHDFDEAYHIAGLEDATAKFLLDALPDCEASAQAKLLYEFHTQLRHDKLRVSDWPAHVQRIRESPGFDVIKASPLSGRSVAKPRGYAGDAVMIDSIYRLDNTVATTAKGQRTYEWELSSAACRSVRARRAHLATLIDQIPGRGRILSVACGHLRESELSSAMLTKNAAQIVALDQDQTSISLLTSLQHPCVQPVVGSVKQILLTSLQLGTFDLIYSAGLYDYLNDNTAKALTAKLIAMLRPGGKLYVANFTPELPDIPYMEAVMDWWLTYRRAEQMRELVSEKENVDVTTQYMSVPNGLNAVVWLSVAAHRR